MNHYNLQYEIEEAKMANIDEIKNPMTYPEAFEEAVNSIEYVPEPARPALMATFFGFVTFGIF